MESSTEVSIIHDTMSGMSQGQVSLQRVSTSRRCAHLAPSRPPVSPSPLPIFHLLHLDIRVLVVGVVPNADVRSERLVRDVAQTTSPERQRTDERVEDAQVLRAEPAELPEGDELVAKELVGLPLGFEDEREGDSGASELDRHPLGEVDDDEGAQKAVGEVSGCFIRVEVLYRFES